MTITEIDLRRRRLGVTYASLSRASETPYQRLYRGTLSDDEVDRVDAALRARERELRAALSTV
jgi:IS4 transposase